MSNGLILEGGGMRGIFAAGVIDYLLDAGIKFDNVIGVSAGACHGCSFVSGQRGRAYATSTDYLDNRDYCSLRNLRRTGDLFGSVSAGACHGCSFVSGQRGRAYATSTDYLDNRDYCSLRNLRRTGDLFGSDFLFHKIPEELYPIDNEAFKKSGIRFQAVVTNCETGCAEYPVISDMFCDAEWIRASSSLPFLANMVEMDGKLYMDGGIADSIPLAQSIRQGNEKNVVVLTRARDYRKKAPSAASLGLMRLKYKAYPKMCEAYAERYKTYNRTLELIAEEEKKGSTFVIAPMGPLDIGRTEKNPDKLRKAYREGYLVAEALGEKLKSFLDGEQ